MITPHWDGQRWRIQARKDGKRFSFSSSVPGAKGRKEVLKKYEQWYYGESTGEKTVLCVSKEFLCDVKARRGETSEAYRQYERYIRLYIAPVCGSRKLCKMTLRDWQNVINEATGRKKALSEKTLKNLRGIIMGIIKFGYEDYQCELLRGDLYIPKGHSKKEKEFLQRDDVKRLLEPSDLWYYPLFIMGLLTGARPGELLGLQLDDVTPDRIIIRRSVNASGIITEGKTANAKRMIPLGRLARSVIQDTIKRNERYNLRTKWIFCSPDGSMGTQSTMRNHWMKLKQERDLPGSVYSLRHTFISMMKNVMPEQMIKDIVGHSASMTTFETYGHILSDDSARAATVIDLTFGDNFGDKKSITDGQ